MTVNGKKRALEHLQGKQDELDAIEKDIRKLGEKASRIRRRIMREALKNGCWNPLSVLGRYHNAPSLVNDKLVYQKNAAELQNIEVVYIDPKSGRPRTLDVECETSNIAKDGTFRSTSYGWGLFNTGNDERPCEWTTYGDVRTLGHVVGFIEANLVGIHDCDKSIHIGPPWTRRKLGRAV